MWCSRNNSRYGVTPHPAAPQCSAVSDPCHAPPRCGSRASCAGGLRPGAGAPGRCGCASRSLTAASACNAVSPVCWRSPWRRPGAPRAALLPAAERPANQRPRHPALQGAHHRGLARGVTLALRLAAHGPGRASARPVVRTRRRNCCGSLFGFLDTVIIASAPFSVRGRQRGWVRRPAVIPDLAILLAACDGASAGPDGLAQIKRSGVPGGWRRSRLPGRCPRFRCRRGCRRAPTARSS